MLNSFIINKTVSDRLLILMIMNLGKKHSNISLGLNELLDFVKGLV